MKRFVYLVALYLYLCGDLFVPPATAEILFESGTLGPTGTAEGAVPSTNVSASIYPGVRFQLTQPVKTELIGGHFVDDLGGTFFGAIVALEDANDFPNSEDRATPDVLGVTQLTFPVASADVFGDLSVSLQPGWYALVFGTGRFGTSGNGGATRNNTDIGDPSYIAFGPNLKWFNMDIFGDFFDNHRFVVLGEIVPEPSSISLLLVSAFGMAMRRIARRQMPRY
jgi:hypothetical protein